MSNKNKQGQQEKSYWQEMREEGKAKDARAKAFYEDRINELLDLRGLGKGTRDYDLQLVRIAAKNWMYLDRNRDTLRLTNAYYSKYFNPGDEENHLSMCVNDGVMLGQMQGSLFVVKTFITYDMTCGRQQQEFEDKRKQIKTDRELYEEARRFYW